MGFMFCVDKREFQKFDGKLNRDLQRKWDFFYAFMGKKDNRHTFLRSKTTFPISRNVIQWYHSSSQKLYAKSIIYSLK